MKVVAINGSPKGEGNTYTLFKEMEKAFVAEGIEFEILHVGNKIIRGCLACGGCAKAQTKTCTTNNEINDYVVKMVEADGILLGSPVYFSGVAGTLKCFLDRAFYVASANGGLFRHKVGASVVADRRAGGVVVFNELNHFINYSEMFMASGNYWTVGFGRMPGEVEQDLEGMQAVRLLAKNMAWLIKAKDLAKHSIPLPEREVKIMTSFIR